MTQRGKICKNILGKNVQHHSQGFSNNVLPATKYSYILPVIYFYNTWIYIDAKFVVTIPEYIFQLQQIQSYVIFYS